MTYQTNNPVGSVDVRDLYDNAGNLDNFSNGPLDAYADRFGVMRQSLQGIRNAAKYQVLGPYAAGLVFTTNAQVFSYLGEFYAPGPSIVLPYTTTGVGAGEVATFRSVGDAVLRQDLSLPTGASLVGALDQTQAGKNREHVSIRDYGGGEEVADNLAAYDAAKAVVGPNGLVYFPRLNTGVYNFTSAALNLSACILDPAPGVTFNVVAFPAVVYSTMRTTTDLTVYVASGAVSNYNFDIKANFHRGSKNGHKQLWVTDTSIRDARPVPINAGTQLLYKQVFLGVADSFTTFVPSGSATDTLFLQPPVGGATQMGCIAMRPGEELNAAVNVTPDAGGEIAAGVVWSTGYAVLRGTTSSGNWTISTKYNGVAPVDVNVPVPGGTTPGYFPLQNTLTVRFLSPIRFQILVSGVVVVDNQLTSGYLMLGGIGATSISAISSSNFNGWNKTTFRNPNGPRLRTLGVIGDSLSDDLHGAWPWWCADALDGVMGIKINGIESRAISGQTTQQQLDNLIANPFGDASDVVIFTGTNDIQGANSLAAFKTSYKALLDLIVSQGRGITLVIPPLWYTQTESGGGGGAAIRAQFGGDIRVAIQRFAADYGFPVVDLTHLSGPINAGYLGSTFADPILRDNIHQTSYFNRLIGMEVSKGVAQSICPEVKTTSNWITFIASAYPVGFSGSLQFRYLDNGDIELRGDVTNAVVIPDNTTVFNMPEFLRSSATRRAPVYGTAGAAAGQMIMAAAGDVTVRGVTTSITVNFDGVRYTR